MIRFFLVLLLNVSFCTPLWAMNEMMPREVEELLSSRTLLETLEFPEGSAVLTPSLKRKIEALLPELHKLYREGKIIRIEGFTGPEGDTSTCVSLAMQRALAIETHIRKSESGQLELFIIGFGNQPTALQLEPKSSRAEIAVYDSVIKMDQVDIETVTFH